MKYPDATEFVRDENEPGGYKMIEPTIGEIWYAAEYDHSPDNGRTWRKQLYISREKLTVTGGPSYGEGNTISQPFHAVWRIKRTAGGWKRLRK